MKTVPVVLLKAKEFKDNMSDEEWRNFLMEAKRNSHMKIDLIARKGAAVLEEYSNSEDEQFDLLQKLSLISPPNMPDTQKLRLSNMVLSELVSQKKLVLKRNFEREAQEEQNAMEDLIRAAQCMESDLSKPTQKKRCRLDENKISESDKYTAVGASTGLKIKSILKTEKPKCSGLIHKKVHFDKDTRSGNANSLPVFDRQQALATVKKLWNMKETTNYIIARVSSYNVTDEDFKSLSSKNCLTDQVVDAYIAYLVQAEIEKGNKIMMYPSQTMTAIVDGSFTIKCYKKMVKQVKEATVT